MGLARIPSIGLGTYMIKGEETAKVIYEALKCGYRHIDCASIYGNQIEIGHGIQQAIKDNIVTREDIWVTSKLWNDMHSKNDVLNSCLETLKDLQLSYLDLYLIHWPFAVDRNNSSRIARIPLAETWCAMESLVNKDLVKNIGVSNFNIQLLHDLLAYCNIRPLTNQVECHIYLAQQKLLDYCTREKIYLTAYSPLARSGTTLRVPDSLEDPVVLEIAKAHSKTSAQVIMKYLLQLSPYMIIIPKTRSLGRLSENLNLDFTLSTPQMDQLARLDRHQRIINTPGPIEVFDV